VRALSFVDSRLSACSRRSRRSLSSNDSLIPFCPTIHYPTKKELLLS
jgi:hypothetical protein